jgi:hypothetical protein
MDRCLSKNYHPFDVQTLLTRTHLCQKARLGGPPFSHCGFVWVSMLWVPHFRAMCARGRVR